MQVVEPKSFEVNVGRTVLTISGNNLTLSCVAEGFPPPSVQWTKDGSPLESDGSDLRLQPLYIKDSGVYTCTASSPLQGLSDAISTNLTVVGWFLIKALVEILLCMYWWKDCNSVVHCFTNFRVNLIRKFL